MRLTDRDKGRLFILALAVLGIVVTVLTDSCGPTPSPYFSSPPTPVPTIYEYDQGKIEEQIRVAGRAATSQYTYGEIVSMEKHVYEWVKDIDNFQLTCPTRILRRDGIDFCVVVKCDSGGGITISCGW